ncbi:MAG: ABC transporter substrate-binding protein [Aestuariivirga sp.]|uniref:MlaC/ttg2D family ABC transporter substrate-binding protein n=1 Tax=Aestuariivirga sp. TaxID=2650926 RepID=UPI0025BAD236|nr:ABC transporter substrate-binding protein [Aestuariivirga sp.]MCA3560438.1 ABC transporter substrate-binding protein [Aestuariivirga sp.]
MNRGNGPLTRREMCGLAVAVLFGFAGPAAASSAAEDYVSGIADQVMRLANNGKKGPALKAQFAALLNRYINLKGIADFALGPYAKRLPAGRRAEFYNLVNNYAAALFNYYVDDFRGNQLDIISTTNQGKFTVIQSAITGGNGREQVKWRLIPASGGFRVADVNVKGVWLTISMKDRFSKVLKQSKGDFDPLFAELREANTW